MAVLKGDKFKAIVMEEDEDFCFFRRDDGVIQFYDIIMPKPKETNKELGVDSVVTVVVDHIRIADDGTPGVFVQLQSN